MDDSLIKFTNESLIRYFTALSQFGYKSYCDVGKLLALIFLQEYLQKYQEYITEADYNEVSKAMECLYGTSCLIPYQYYQTNQATFNIYAGSNVQSTEASEAKSTEVSEDKSTEASESTEETRIIQ